MFIINKPSALVEQMQIWGKENNATNLFINHASIYMKLGIERGIDPVIAYVQYAIETNFGRFGKKGILDKSYCNPSGLRLLVDKSKSRSSFSFKRFKTWNEGIEAHLDHLALLAGVDGYPKEETNDPRHLPNLYNTCKRVSDLQNTWNSISNYARDVEHQVKLIQRIQIETSNDINVLKAQNTVLLNRLQEKDTEITLLKKEVENVKTLNAKLTDKNEEYLYDVEQIQKELTEYKNVVEKLKKFMTF